MKAMIVLGVVLSALGAFLLIRGASLTTKRDVLSVGPLEVTAEEQHPVSPWIGGIILVAGVGLVVVGATRKA